MRGLLVGHLRRNIKNLSQYGYRAGDSNVFCQFRLMSTKEPSVENPFHNVEEKLKNIDTTLTPEQRERAEFFKKKIKGGSRTPRCTKDKIYYISFDDIACCIFEAIYRDVPTPEELKQHFGSNQPRIPANAEALIDLGLSLIPKRMHELIKRNLLC